MLADDKMIDEEGIDSLTMAELKTACRERGIPDKGRSRAFLSRQLAVNISYFGLETNLEGMARIIYQEERTDDFAHLVSRFRVNRQEQDYFAREFVDGSYFRYDFL